MSPNQQKTCRWSFHFQDPNSSPCSLCYAPQTLILQDYWQSFQSLIFPWLVFPHFGNWIPEPTFTNHGKTSPTFCSPTFSIDARCVIKNFTAESANEKRFWGLYYNITLANTLNTTVIRVGLRGGATEAFAPGPPLQEGPTWWNLFVSNKILVWKIFVIQKRYKNTTLLYIILLCCIKYQELCCVKYHFSTSLTVCQF